jgi:hypothetical protein
MFGGAAIYLVGSKSNAVPELHEPEGNANERLDVTARADDQHDNAKWLYFVFGEIDPGGEGSSPFMIAVSGRGTSGEENGN